MDQAETAGPFRWNEKPDVELRASGVSEQGGFVDGFCAYRGIRHRRRVRLDEGRLLVLDEIAGPTGRTFDGASLESRRAANEVHFAFSDPVEEVGAEVSPVYGMKTPSSALIVRCRGTLPLAVAMCLDARGGAH